MFSYKRPGKYVSSFLQAKDEGNVDPKKKMVTREVKEAPDEPEAVVETHTEPSEPKKTNEVRIPQFRIWFQL